MAELVEYCQTQARLLQGTVETLDEETAALLDDLDEDIADLRSRLGVRSDSPDAATQSPAVSGAAGGDASVRELEAMERDLEEKQAVVTAKQARREAFAALAAGYLDLAETLQSRREDSQAALERILEFEAEHDAPAYFDERATLLGAATDRSSSAE